MNAQMSLSADSLIKKYGPKTVVDSVSLSVDQGEIVGLLGPNGAGKNYNFLFNCWPYKARLWTGFYKGKKI